MKKTELKKIALHEATHLYMAWRLGAFLQGVTIDGRPYSTVAPREIYHCGYASAARKNDVDHRDVLISISPGFTEEKLFGKISSGTLANCQEIMDALLKHEVETKPLIAAAKKAIKKSSNPLKQSSIFYKNLRHKIKPLFDDSRAGKAVQTLAKILIKNKILNGWECAKIFEKVFGCAPVGALPAVDHLRGPNAKTNSGRLAYAAECLKKAQDALRTGHDNTFIDQLINRLVEVRFFVEAQI